MIAILFVLNSQNIKNIIEAPPLFGERCLDMIDYDGYLSVDEHAVFAGLKHGREFRLCRLEEIDCGMVALGRAGDVFDRKLFGAQIHKHVDGGIVNRAAEHVNVVALCRVSHHLTAVETGLQCRLGVLQMIQLLIKLEIFVARTPRGRSIFLKKFESTF